MDEIIKSLRDCADGNCDERCGRYHTPAGCRTTLMRDAADLIEKLTGPDTGYATGYQIGYATGSADGKREQLAKDKNVPTKIVVEVSGGMVQNVWSDKGDTQVDVADLDTDDPGEAETAQNILEIASDQGFVCVW